MKRFIIQLVLIMFLGGFMNSCDDFLDVPLKSSVSTSNFFNSQEDFEAALTGVYYMTTSAEWDPGHRWGNYFQGFLYLGRVGTDECLKEGNDTQGQISNYTFTPTNQIVSRTWFVQYMGISRANLLIDKLLATTVEMPQADKNRILGEAYFMRGFFYFQLARYFGEVPLVLHEATDLGQVNTEKAPLAKVYEQIVSDFTNAESLLPVNNTNGHAQMYAATTFLAKTYLQMAGEPLKDPNAAALAEKAAYRVIKSGKFSLVKDYFSLFDASNEYSSEYIFDIDFSDQPTGNYGGQVGTTEGVDNPWDLYWREILCCQEFYEKFNEKDLRRDAIATFRWENDENGQPVKVDNLESSGNTYYVYKFRHPIKAEDRGSNWKNWSNPINFPVTRYSDVLLMYAEAVNRAHNGPTPEALEYVNQVRRRGFGKDINTPDSQIDLPMMGAEAFNDAILQERSFELCFEGHRWADLVRFGKLETAVKSLGKYDRTKELTQQANNFKPKHLYLPIPQDAIDSSHGRITQNPLWVN